MSALTPCVGLLGATGAVGDELLRLLDDRSLPLGELRVFASVASEGSELDFRGDEVFVEAADSANLSSCDLLFCAAPEILRDHLDALRESGTRVVDLSGVLELDSQVPVFHPGERPHGPWVAIPRGVVGGLALALRPLGSLRGLTLTTLESAVGAGRSGVEALQAQTIHVLQAMDGDAGEAGVFPQALAFDALPQVGEFLEGGETHEERRLRHVLRRVLEQPALRIDVMRIRIPTFMGALASVALELEAPLGEPELSERWSKSPGLELLAADELPTPRNATTSEDVQIGRVRSDPRSGRLSFVLALDPLQRGAARTAIEAARQLLAQ